LSAAEQGRTQALKDLMEYNYGLSTPSDNRGESSAPEVILSEALSYLPSNAVFFAKTDSNGLFEEDLSLNRALRKPATLTPRLSFTR